MKLVHLTWFVALLVIFSGCATTKLLQATGGSKADAVVELSYQYGAYEYPVVDSTQGTAVTTERCKAWGYSGAQPFGGSIEQCQRYDGYGNCSNTLVTIKYQCVN